MALLEDPVVTDIASVQRNFDRIASLLHFGTGTPEGVLNARCGSFYGREDGTAGSAAYFKTTPLGTLTGWVAVA